MTDLAQIAANVGLVLLVALLIPSTYRIWTGPSAIERLQALDLTTTVLVGVVVVLGIVVDNSMFIDIGIALAAFSFVSSVAIARFISEGRSF